MKKSIITKSQLLKIKKETNSELKKDVIRIILSQAETGYIDSWIQDLLSHGCSSGMVGCLIYHYDTHKFFKKHCKEILEMLAEMQSELELKVPVNDDVENWLAWMSFEETAREIYEQDLALEL